MTIKHVSVNDGKYTVVLEYGPKGQDLHVLRNGKSCSEFSGSKLIYWLAVELAEARKELDKLQGNVDDANMKAMEMAR